MENTFATLIIEQCDQLKRQKIKPSLLLAGKNVRQSFMINYSVFKIKEYNGITTPDIDIGEYNLAIAWLDHPALENFCDVYGKEKIK